MRNASLLLNTGKGAVSLHLEASRFQGVVSLFARCRSEARGVRGRRNDRCRGHEVRGSHDEQRRVRRAEGELLFRVQRLHQRVFVFRLRRGRSRLSRVDLRVLVVVFVTNRSHIDYSTLITTHAGKGLDTDAHRRGENTPSCSDRRHLNGSDWSCRWIHRIRSHRNSATTRNAIHRKRSHRHNAARRHSRNRSHGREVGRRDSRRDSRGGSRSHGGHAGNHAGQLHFGLRWTLHHGLRWDVHLAVLVLALHDALRALVDGLEKDEQRARA